MVDDWYEWLMITKGGININYEVQGHTQYIVVLLPEILCEETLHTTEWYPSFLLWSKMLQNG